MPGLPGGGLDENKAESCAGEGPGAERETAGCVSVTQSKRMPPVARRFLLLPLILLAGAPVSPARQLPAEFSVEGPHPRLLLPARRLRLLGRERERRSMRWQQFLSVVEAAEALPEPGFAHALCYVAGGGEHHARRAIAWALSSGGDLRQLALVYDWCHNQLDPQEEARLAAAIRDGLERARALAPDIARVRDRLFAAVALAEAQPEAASAELRFAVEKWWAGRIIPALRRGEEAIGRRQTYPLMEILHVVRDHLRIDLREALKSWFAVLPIYHLLTYYPAPYPAATGDFHIPVYDGSSEPDLRLAALSRAAELSLVAFDPNALETQFVQGWCMQDRFMMRDPFGAPYEFFWANPYHPGLSYHNAPLVLHQRERGLLVARTSWDEDALWFYHDGRSMQAFDGGRIKHLKPADLTSPLVLGQLAVRSLPAGGRFEIAADDEMAVYVVGLEPRGRYEVEVDDEEMFELAADAGGILVLEFPAKRRAGVLVRPAGRGPR